MGNAAREDGQLCYNVRVPNCEEAIMAKKVGKKASKAGKCCGNCGGKKGCKGC